MSQAMNIYAPRSQDGTIAFVAGLMAPWIFGFFITLVLLYVGGGALGYVYGTTTAAAIGSGILALSVLGYDKYQADAQGSDGVFDFRRERNPHSKLTQAFQFYPAHALSTFFLLLFGKAAGVRPDANAEH